MPGPRNKLAKRKISIQKEKIRVARKVSASSGTSSEEETLDIPNENGLLDAPLFAPQPRIASPSPSNGHHLTPIDGDGYLNELKKFTIQFANLEIPSQSSEVSHCSYSSISHLQNTIPIPHPPQSPRSTSPPPLPTPCIHDPGNGPRVKSLLSFLKSPFAAQPSWEVEDCMEYHGQDVMDFLQTLLPSEAAMILFYNRTRENSRICPVCRRFYTLGDRLAPSEFEPPLGERKEALLMREQDQSGLCSFICFTTASFNYPFPSSLPAWGHYDHEMDSSTRSLLNSPLEMEREGGVDDEGLGMYLRLTRFDAWGFREILGLCYGNGSEGEKEVRGDMRGGEQEDGSDEEEEGGEECCSGCEGCGSEEEEY